MAPLRFRSILITGASSGIGRALALAYAGPDTRLALGGRDAARLEETATTCRAAGAGVTTEAGDVGDAAAMAAWTQAVDSAAPLDLVIACAGLSGEAGHPGDDPDLARRIYTINVLGTLNTVEPLLPRLRTRRRGQVAIVSSVAGFRGMPRGPAYSGSKAALITHGQAWREALAPEGIGVSVVCPGYVRTPMTARHRFRMPFLLKPDEAARRIAAGVAANKALIVFPWPIALAGWLFRTLPPAWTRILIPGPTIYSF